MPASIASRALADRELLALEQDFALERRVHAEDRLRHFRPARADQAGEAEDFAPRHLEADGVGGRYARAQPAHLEGRAGLRPRARTEKSSSSRPIISETMLSCVISLAASSPTFRPSRKADDAVGDLHDLVEAVRDVDDAHALRAQVLDDRRAAARSRRGQRAGRLVHDDDARVERQRLGDLDHLLLRDRQLGAAACAARCPAPGARGTAALSAFIVARSMSCSGRPRSARGPRKMLPRHVQVVQDVQFLVDETDAQRHARRDRRGSTTGRPSKRICPSSGWWTPPSTLHQRRFARAVLADQPDDLARAPPTAHAAQRHDAGETLA